MLSATVALLALQASLPITPNERVYESLKSSIFTVEVHPVASDTRSVLGSGYVFSSAGKIVTNYHVVASYIEEPERYRIRVKNHTGTYAAQLLSFDLINDLALLEAPLAAAPLKAAPALGSPGSTIVAFGNPEGLGLSLIEGVFNGFAEKGFVERMLLSMPLNSGMSGGPILNKRQEVIGTNVSTMWRSNSLSFGVPVTKVGALLSAPALKTTRAELLRETNRQLALLEASAAERAVAPFTTNPPPDPIKVGAVQITRPPEVYQCWNDTQVHEEEGMTKTSYSCNLQFTPSVEDVGEVGSIEILVEHFVSKKARYGFYGALSEHGASHHGVEAREPDNGVLSAPECSAQRLRTQHLAWKATTCSYAYVKHPGHGYFALAATSVSHPSEAAYVTLHARGLALESFLELSRAFLAQVRLAPGLP